MDKIHALIEDTQLTWREILYESIKGLDPWDIDLGQLATRYAGHVRDMKEMSFKIPANVVLVSSVLLRMKADILNPHDPEPYTELSDSFNFLFGEEVPDFAQFSGDADDFEFSLKPKRVPQRRVTAEELISAIQKALEERGAKKSILLSRKAADGVTTLVIPPDLDITQLIEDTYLRVVEQLSTKEVVLFSDLAQSRTDTIRVFLSLLHLWNKQRLHLRQERIYDEIFIRNTPFAD